MPIFKITIEPDEKGILKRTEYILEQMSLLELHSVQKYLIAALADVNNAVTSDLTKRLNALTGVEK